MFQTFVALIETQISACIKVLRLIQGESICLTIFKTTYSRRGSFLNALARTPHSKMGWLSARIDIS